MLKEGKIKKQKPLEPLKEEEVPYKLSESWEWCRIRPISPDWGRIIDVSSINKEKGRVSEKVQLLDADSAPSRARKIVKKETVIYSTVRPYLLNSAIIEKNTLNLLQAQHLQ